MNPEMIKAYMRMQGISATDIAHELGVTQSAVHRVIHGNSTSKRIAMAVSKVIDKTPEELWGKRYQTKKRHAS